MKPEALRSLLEAVQAGGVDVEQAFAKLRELPFRDLGYAKIDHHRALRCGAPEVVYGETKTPEELAGIATELASRGANLLVTRVDATQAKAIQDAVPAASYEARARAVVLLQGPQPEAPPKPVLVICAGTSDLPVALEAKLTAEVLGNRVELLCDVGVAGLHRLLAHGEKLREAGVLVVVAGMEGALPSVVAGLVDRPVIAVPTSVGYGAALSGFTALMGMLTSCAPGLSVVNVDNGFGGGYAAAKINRLSIPSK